MMLKSKNAAVSNLRSLAAAFSVMIISLFGTVCYLLVLHSFCKSLVSKISKLTDDLYFLCDVGSTVEAVKVMLELCQIVRSCVFGILDLLVIAAPGLVCLREALNESPMV